MQSNPKVNQHPWHIASFPNFWCFWVSQSILGPVKGAFKLMRGSSLIQLLSFWLDARWQEKNSTDAPLGFKSTIGETNGIILLHTQGEGRGHRSGLVHLADDS